MCNHEEGSWLSLSVCRWKVTPLLSKVVALARLYPRLQNFFMHILGVRDADLADVIDELMEMAEQVEDVRITKDLLAEACRKNRQGDRAANALARMRESDLHLFPIETRDDGLALRSAKDDSWFIADTKRLQTLFAGEVPLLALEDDVFIKFRVLIPQMGLERRLLSKCVCKSTEKQGTSQFHQEFTHLLRSKAAHISRYAIDMNNHRTFAHSVTGLFNLTSENDWNVA